MANKVVLVVDDYPLITRLVQVNLERKGYVVKTALDGYEGLAALRSAEAPPDLVLLDVTMPYMDGFQMLQEMKNDPNLEPIPVVMMTARAHDADIIQGERMHAQHYLTKPINPTELLQIVRIVIGEPDISAL